MSLLILWIVVAMVGLAGLIASANNFRFALGLERAVDGMWIEAEEARPVDRRRLEALPNPVRRYLESAVGTRARAPRAARLRHTGTFRPKLDAGWHRIRGEEYFNADPPGFVWHGRLRITPGVWIDARDESVAGVGRMLVAAEGAFTLADSTGPRLDESALERLLAELVWMPTALLDDRYVVWEPIDERHARVTLTVNGRVASGTFEFGNDGLPVTFSAIRPRDVGNGQSVPTLFSGECRDYRRVDGLLVPHEMNAYWHVEGERVPYARFKVEELEYDAKAPF